MGTCKTKQECGVPFSWRAVAGKGAICCGGFIMTFLRIFPPNRAEHRSLKFKPIQVVMLGLKQKILLHLK